VLSSLLLTFVFTLLLFSNKLVINWQKKATLEDAALLCMETLTRDIGNIDEIQMTGKDNLSFTTRSDKEINYTWNGNQIQRNGEPLNEDKIVTDSLEFIYLGKMTGSDTADVGIINLEDDFGFFSKQDKLERISGIRVKMTLSGNGKSITSSSFVRIRKAISVY